MEVREEVVIVGNMKNDQLSYMKNSMSMSMTKSILKIVILILTASVLIGTVITVLLAIAEKDLFNAAAISTGKGVLFTLGLGIAIFDESLPITSLFLNVKN